MRKIILGWQRRVVTRQCASRKVGLSLSVSQRREESSLFRLASAEIESEHSAVSHGFDFFRGMSRSNGGALGGIVIAAPRRIGHTLSVTAMSSSVDINVYVG